MSIEGTANTEYASLSGKIRTFVVDKSLTISGACADAKATGDAIESKAGEAAKEAVNERLPDAVAEEFAEQLPGELEALLDDTLTKSDKAAQAAAVGEMDTVLRGLIGEKSSFRVGSYVGTGTVGEGSVSITFDTEPELVIMLGFTDTSGTLRKMFGLPNGYNQSHSEYVVIPELLTAEYKKGDGFYYDGGYGQGDEVRHYGKFDQNTLCWYYAGDYSGTAELMCNAAGYTYYYMYFYN